MFAFRRPEPTKKISLDATMTPTPKMAFATIAATLAYLGWQFLAEAVLQLFSLSRL